MNNAEKDWNLASLFIPNFIGKRVQYLNSKERFVHYTSAINAISIIRSKRIWMRNVKCMNDFMEIEHGFDLLVRFFQKDSKTRERFFQSMNAFWPDQVELAFKNFEAWLGHIRENTFVACISEHEPSEDRLGRLSMWRAYGNQNIGAALVINSSPFNVIDDVGIISSPVLYVDEHQFFSGLENCLDNVDKNHDFIKSHGPEKFNEMIFLLLFVHALCVKHPGFHEEREWRIIYIPEMWDAGDLIEQKVEMASGVPQIVHKLKLENTASRKLTAISPNDLIDRVIIGPCAFPMTVKEAFISELRQAGVENAEKKVFMSEIPLRT
ncbi:MAG: DUF2971 domain-containing protein [Beijerinckiaceae bacterium]|nr:DUF2971 domain-containing protein [Beijerinckiaceae bacterium]